MSGHGRAVLVVASWSLLAASCPKDGPDGPRPPQGPTVLNVVSEGRDVNGLPLNPRWAFQKAGESGLLALADPEWQCGGFPTNTDESRRLGDPRCTDQPTKVDLPTGWHKPVCGAEFLMDWRWGKLRGHVNWRPATVSGYLTWNDAAGRYPFGDGDYTLSLEPADPDGEKRLPGLTRYNRVKGYATHAYHLEYNAVETVDRFTHDWWVAHREKVKAKKAHASGDAEPGQIPNGTWAVVTGLFGLDAEHKGHSELHPVYAMSVLTSCAQTPAADGFFDDEWVVFVRNWGNEGFCADWKAYHMADFQDSRYALRIPLPGVDPSSIALGPRTRFFANFPRAGESTPPGKGPFLVPASDSVEVRFQLPEMSGPLTRQNDPPRMHGLLHLRWKAAAGGARTCPRRAPSADVAALAAPEEAGADGEDVLRRLRRQRLEAGLALPDDAAALVAAPDDVEVTDRGEIPAPDSSVELWDRVVRVPKTAGAEPALAREVDEPPPAEVCEAADALLQPGEGADLDEETRRRMEELRAYCRRTQRRAGIEALYRAALASPASAERVDAWLATLPRMDGYYVVEGDIKMTEEQLRASLQREHRTPREPSAELSVNLDEHGVPTYWKEPTSRRLTYAVDRRTFPDAPSHAEIVAAMKEATHAWEEACPECGISITHLAQHDDAVSTGDVTFVVRFRDADLSYVATAFFPNDPPLARFLDVYPGFFTTTYDRVGVLRHELGHVLGYRHAHIGIPGCFAEDGNWLALTAYDVRSVMHYLCGGGGDRQLAISDLDREGHRRLYLGR